MATILYARVSTAEQTIEHQRVQAQAAGYVFDEVVTDDGVSGVTTKLIDRAGGRRLFDLLRAGDTLVVRWVDRLGRNYEDVSDNIRAFMRRGVVIKTIINGMTFDGATKDPMQKAVRDALIGFMAALSQAQAEADQGGAEGGHCPRQGRCQEGLPWAQAQLHGKPGVRRGHADRRGQRSCGGGQGAWVVPRCDLSHTGESRDAFAIVQSWN